MGDRGGLSVEVSNGRELRKLLKMAGVDIADLKTLNNKIAQMVLDRASATVPRRSGKLAGSGRANRAQAKAIVTYRVPYALPIHWGWPRHNIEARPWLRDAARALEPQIEQLYMAEIQKVLDGIELET